MAKISNEKATELLRQCYAKYFIESSHFIIRDKIENEKYVFYNIIDERLGKKFYHLYFSGQKMGFYHRFIYDIAQEKFIEFDIRFLDDFISKEDQLKSQKEMSLRDEIIHYRVIDSERFYRIYKKIGMEDFWPNYRPTIAVLYDLRYLKLCYKDFENSSISDEKIAIFIDRLKQELKELKIKFYFENETLYIDRKIPDDF